MKSTLIIVVALALSLLNVADAWEAKRDNNPADRTECMYNRDSSTLMCHGQADERHECEADLKLPKEINYELYGIEILEETPVKRFHLIPRKLDNSGWMKHSIIEAGIKKDISMYESDQLEDYGLKVKDAECFGKLVELLGKSQRHEKVFIDSELIENPESTKVIADLMVSDKKQNGKSKRWWGMGMWGYPMIYSPWGLWGKRDTSESMPVNKELSDFKQQVEAGFEVNDDNNHALVKEIQKLKRDVKKMQMGMIIE